MNYGIGEVKDKEMKRLTGHVARARECGMSMADTLRDKLTAAFAPTVMEVMDESAMHAGHAGAQPGGETHFRVRIVSAAFEGLSRVDRQRRIYAVLDAELKAQVHALALSALTPAEAASRARP